MPTIHACGCPLDLIPDMASLFERATIHERKGFTPPYGATRDLSNISDVGLYLPAPDAKIAV